MAKNKNALRKHYIAGWKKGEEKPTEEYVRLAHLISTISDNTNEETDDTGYYDGDGTKEESVVGVALGYTAEGQFDSTDEAQKLIASKMLKLGDDRKVWHKIERTDGKVWEGVANLSSIIAGAGEATEFEEFSCNITYVQIPKETEGSLP